MRPTRNDGITVIVNNEESGAIRGLEFLSRASSVA